MANFFTDRFVEYPGRVKLTATGNTDEYDMTRSEGSVYADGTPLNAENLNNAMQDVIDLITPDRVFFAEINSTTYAEVIAALNDNKTVLAIVSNSYGTFNVYPYMYAGNNVLYFGRLDGDASDPYAKVYTLTSSDVWSSTSKQLVVNEVTTATPSITTSTGTLISANIARMGKMRSLNLAVKRSTVTSAGSNIYAGTINKASDRPATLVNAAGYYGSAAAILQISAAGNITVRVIGASIEANGATYCGCSYLVP